MVDLELSDVYVGILIKLYWNGHQASRSTPDLREEIEYLIDAGFIEEFQRDMIWWGKLWFVRITEQGVAVLKQEIDPLRVFDLFLTIIDSLEGAGKWVMMFDLAQLPVAFTHPEALIRDAAEVRLMEIENKIELSDAELLQMMQCYRAVVERHRGWIPSRAERRLTLLGLLRSTVINPLSFGHKEVDYALNLTDKGTRFLEDHYPVVLVGFLTGCLDRGLCAPMLLDSYHMNRLLRLFSVLPAERLVELLVSDDEFIRNHAVRQLEQLL
jgi:hypothetical protein